MLYTSHGLMTAADLAEVRADYDLGLCSCCENGDFAPGGPDGDWQCRRQDCGHDRTGHAGHGDALNETDTTPRETGMFDVSQTDQQASQVRGGEGGT